MFLERKDLKHISSITHEGKVLLFCTDSHGEIRYTVKQDGYEDTYRPEGWEDWKRLALPDLEPDLSVAELEKKELTYKDQGNTKYLLRSIYTGRGASAIAPIQLVSGMGHLYVFRQSQTNNCLWVDRFVLDGMTNTLVPKLEVRFKRSRQRHTPYLTNQNASIPDSLDFRDTAGSPFYEPTRELTFVGPLKDGWFSVILMPTSQPDQFYWHIFAYNQDIQEVELLSVRVSQGGRFDVRDILMEDPETGNLRPSYGILRRTLQLQADGSTLIPSGAPAATRYDVQTARMIQRGNTQEEQLFREAIRLMLLVPVGSQGSAALSFSVAPDGTLSQIGDTQITPLRSIARDVPLPVNEFDQIRGEEMYPADQIEGEIPQMMALDGQVAINVRSSDVEKIIPGQNITIESSQNIDNEYSVVGKEGDDLFTIDAQLSASPSLAHLKAFRPEAFSVREGEPIRISVDQNTGNIRIRSLKHGLKENDRIRIKGLTNLDGTYTILRKLDNAWFLINARWNPAEITSEALDASRRRSIRFDGGSDYIALPSVPLTPATAKQPFSYTFSAWAFPEIAAQEQVILAQEDGLIELQLDASGKLVLKVKDAAGGALVAAAGNPVEDQTWVHCAGTIQYAPASDAASQPKLTLRLYLNGETVAETSTDQSIAQTPAWLPKFYVGCGPAAGNATRRNFAGKIADVRIWDIARQAADLRQGRYTPLVGRETGLVGYWRMGAIAEIDGNRLVTDFSVFGNAGQVYGDPHVSEATLLRSPDQTGFSSDQLVAVTQNAMYVERFEYRADRSGKVSFEFDVWGKTSHRAESAIPCIMGSQSTDQEVSPGSGWYEATCTFSVPKGITLVRSFGIDIRDSDADWKELEIRRHRLTMISDSISQAQANEQIHLTAPAEPAQVDIDRFIQLEAQEGALIKEKQELKRDLRLFNNLASIEAELTRLKSMISNLQSSVNQKKQDYDSKNADIFNYLCTIEITLANSSGTSEPHLLCLSSGVFGATTDRAFTWLPRSSFISPQDESAILKFDKGKYGHLVSQKADNQYLLSIYQSGSGAMHTSERKNVSVDYTVGSPSSTADILFEPRTDGSYLITCSDEKYQWSGINEYRRFLYLYFPSNPFGQSGAVFTNLERQDQWNLGQMQAQITKVPGQPTPQVVRDAYNAWQNAQNELNSKQKELSQKQADYDDRQNKINEWNARLTVVRSELKSFEIELGNLRNTLLEAFRKNPTRSMDPLVTDARGLTTRGALLPALKPMSRLNLIETSEGMVQVSYLDQQVSYDTHNQQFVTHVGGLQQMNFDATADSMNATLNEWLLDRQRACLKISKDGRVELTPPMPIHKWQQWTVELFFRYPLFDSTSYQTVFQGDQSDGDSIIIGTETRELMLYHGENKEFFSSGFVIDTLTPGWHHLAIVGTQKIETGGGNPTSKAIIHFYVNGQRCTGTICRDAQGKLQLDEQGNPRTEPTWDCKFNNALKYIGNDFDPSHAFGQITELRIWNMALGDEEIDINSKTLLSGQEPGLVAYFPFNVDQGTTIKARNADQIAKIEGSVEWQPTILSSAPPQMSFQHPVEVVSSEYALNVQDTGTRKMTSLLCRFFAIPVTDGVNLLQGKRIELLERVWVGNAQFKPTLLGYIEGAPPIPSENLTLEDDYNGATSVALTISSDVAFTWDRSQDAGLGVSLDVWAGGGLNFLFGEAKLGGKLELQAGYSFLNETSITAGRTLTLVDRLELRGTQERQAKFSFLGRRFIPKNIGYALVVSGLADVYILRLKRSKRMFAYQVTPNPDVPPDINTITYLINPAYTMNGSLDGMTGSQATSDRYHQHVPQMRAQYGSLYPASYYRLEEAYALKRRIEAKDAEREAYFMNYDSRLTDQISLANEIDDENETQTMTADDPEAKQAEIKERIQQQEQQVHAIAGYASWQRRMEQLQVKAGKRNIVNTYVWDADGGLRSEGESFASTVEHMIGGAFNLEGAIGIKHEEDAPGGFVELSALLTAHCTQTMTKTETRSTGFSLDVDLSGGESLNGGVESRGITDYDDNPLLPGEKVDRYRFMSFFLEGDTQNFDDFFKVVVDPEWLQSNDEEARALRQINQSQKNKTWRVLHRVTYLERPSLMGFGQDSRPVAMPTDDPDQPQERWLEYLLTWVLRKDLERSFKRLEDNQKQAQLLREMLLHTAGIDKTWYYHHLLELIEAEISGPSNWVSQLFTELQQSNLPPEAISQINTFKDALSDLYVEIRDQISREESVESDQFIWNTRHKIDELKYQLNLIIGSFPQLEKYPNVLTAFKATGEALDRVIEGQ